MEEQIYYPAYTVATECCALNMLRATNNDSLQTLKEVIEKNKSYHLDETIKSFIGVRKGIGARALFCIVSMGEEVLEANLKTLGFKKRFPFGRRRGYGGGVNTFYSLTW